MDEKMIVVFFGLLIKWAKPTVLLTRSLQPICRPKPILQGQPNVILQFLWSPSFLNHLVNARLKKTEELQLICGRRRVLPVVRELPPNIILHVLFRCTFGPSCNLYSTAEEMNAIGAPGDHSSH
jgi:hypothetical protein